MASETTETADVTVVIPSIPPRTDYLRMALNSVAKQTAQPREIIVEVDHNKEGAGVTRTRGLMKVTTEWTAFLDDDDTMSATHLADLLQHQAETGADVVYPWFFTPGGSDPFPEFEGRPWNPDEPHIFPITTLVRTSMAQAVGGFPSYFLSSATAGEDWEFWKKMFAAGARVSHLNKRTWCWYHRGGMGGMGNTSGHPLKW